MRRFLTSTTFALSMSVAISASAVTVGQTAPEFMGTSADGKPLKLSEFGGKYVVLEWTNPHCPYVQKHYDSGNMPSLQKETRAKGVAWITINSTNKAHQDYMAPDALSGWLKQRGAQPSATVMDSSGEIGRLYSARTTPHMYVVDPKGLLVYAGAIDDKRGTDPGEVKQAKNFVRLALTEVMSNKPLSSPATTPYGCSVKY